MQYIGSQVAGILRFYATQRRGTGDPGGQPDSRRKCVASTVAHQSVLIFFHHSLSLDWWCVFSASVLVETGLAQSRLFFGVVFPRIVFARQPITMFLVLISTKPNQRNPQNLQETRHHSPTLHLNSAIASWRSIPPVCLASLQQPTLDRAPLPCEKTMVGMSRLFRVKHALSQRGHVGNIRDTGWKQMREITTD